MKGFFATVEIYRRPVWNIYSYFCQNFIRIPFFVFHNGGYGIRMSWVKNILKINKRGGGGMSWVENFLKINKRGGRLLQTREYGWFQQFCKFS